MGALSSFRVGELIADNYIACYQRIGSFLIVENGGGGLTKQGGNVATMLCAPNGRVIHAVAGPVQASELTAQLEWANRAYEEMRELPHGDAQELKLRELHSIVLQNIAGHHQPAWAGVVGHLNNDQRIHAYLRDHRQVDHEEMGAHIFQSILNERIDTEDTPLFQFDRELLRVCRSSGLVIVAGRRHFHGTACASSNHARAQQLGFRSLDIPDIFLDEIPILNSSHESLLNSIERQEYELTDELAQERHAAPLIAIYGASGNVLFVTRDQQELESQLRVEISTLVERAIASEQLNRTSLAEAMRYRRILQRLMSDEEMEIVARRLEPEVQVEAEAEVSQPVSALDRPH